MKKSLYVIRVDVAYNADFIVVTHTSRQKALKDYRERIEKWKGEWGSEGQFLEDFEHEKKYEYRDMNTGDGAIFYFNVVNAGDELIL